jgi:RNA polymerase I-specific transcription initiation factor RRN3
VADQYLRECLQMLVNNFTPPIVGERNEVPPWAVSRKKDIFSYLCESLKTISDTVPLAPRMLRDIIDRSMPKLFDNKAVSVNSIIYFLFSSSVEFSESLLLISLN